MIVVVTGASGYLGSRLCTALVRHGHSVRAFVRRSSDLSLLSESASGGEGFLEVVYGDVNDYPSLLAAFSGSDVVFHCAALVEPWIPDPSRFRHVNVEGLKKVLEAAKEARTVGKIVYTSSFFALGSTDGHIADETQVHREEGFCTEYEKSKVEADKIALKSATEGGVPIVAVYPGVIYGEGKLTSGNMVAKLMVELFSGRLPGYLGKGDNKFSFCHVDDVAEGHVAAMERGVPGERYLLTGENASFRHLFDLACIITGRKKPRFCVPLWVLQIYGYAMIVMHWVTGRLPVISPPGVEVMRHAWEYSCEKAKRDLGYTPRSLRDGLQQTLFWLKAMEFIK